MPNLGGDYPGRQIFLGGLKSGEPAFAYFVSGRSKKSQERYAAPYDPMERAVRVRPLDPNEEFDPFRHYQAVRIDPKSGLLLVSNSQAPNDMLVEFYTNETVQENSFRTYMGKVLALAGPEHDNSKNPTPRIAGLVLQNENILGIIAAGATQSARYYTEYDGKLAFVQTYDGNVNYRALNVFSWWVRLLQESDAAFFETDQTTAHGLADEIFDMSDFESPEYGKLRVCSVAGVRNGNGPGGWDIAVRNRHAPPAL